MDTSESLMTELLNQIIKGKPKTLLDLRILLEKGDLYFFNALKTITDLKNISLKNGETDIHSLRPLEDALNHMLKLSIYLDKNGNALTQRILDVQFLESKIKDLEMKLKLKNQQDLF